MQSAKERQDLESRTVETLSTLGRPASLNEVRLAMGYMSETSVQRAMDALIAREQVVMRHGQTWATPGASGPSRPGPA
jgi:hypothetical protein